MSEQFNPKDQNIPSQPDRDGEEQTASTKPNNFHLAILKLSDTKTGEGRIDNVNTLTPEEQEDQREIIASYLSEFASLMSPGDRAMFERERTVTVVYPADVDPKE